MANEEAKLAEKPTKFSDDSLLCKGFLRTDLSHNSDEDIRKMWAMGSTANEHAVVNCPETVGDKIECIRRVRDKLNCWCSFYSYFERNIRKTPLLY